jgi:type I restriction enzyme, S subunit
VSRQEFEFDELCALPEGWNWIPLEGLMKEPKRDIVDGPFGSDLKAAEYQSEGIPIARLQNIDRNIFLYKKIQFLSSEKAKQLDRHNFKAGDILLTKLGDPLGKACIVPENIPHGIIVADLVRIRADIRKIDTKYLSYAINSPFIIKQFENHTKGTTRPRVNLTLIRKLPIPVAPITQQKYIVAEIEKQFSRLDEAVTALKRIQANLKRYKATVLKAAVEGKLTKQWRKEHPNVEPAVPLLKGILAERRAKWESEELAKMKAKGIKPKDDSWKKKYKEPAGPDTANLPELPEGWVWASIELLGDVLGGLTKNPKRSNLPLQLPYLRVANVYANELRLDDIEHIGVEEKELDRLLVKRWDLLVVEGNGSPEQIGRVAIWDGSIEPCVHQNHIIKVRLSAACLPKWALYWLLSPNGRDYIREVSSSTSGLYTLSVGKISGLPVPLPSSVEQEQVINDIERCLSVTGDLETTIETNLKRAERLRQRILHRAFAGGLG